MMEFLTSILILGGAAFMLLAAIGIVRMPDVYLRLQTTTKAVTLGAGGILTAFAFYFGTTGVITRVLLVIAFLGITVPVWAHMIGRAAYIVGVPLWEGTVVDELKEAREQHVEEKIAASDPAPEDPSGRHPNPETSRPTSSA